MIGPDQRRAIMVSGQYLQVCGSIELRKTLPTLLPAAFVLKFHFSYFYMVPTGISEYFANIISFLHFLRTDRRCPIADASKTAPQKSISSDLNFQPPTLSFANRFNGLGLGSRDLDGPMCRLHSDHGATYKSMQIYVMGLIAGHNALLNLI